jgi:hypothetical protein
MESGARAGLSDRAARELTDQGRDDLQGTVAEAVGNISASHKGRPLDEIEAVLSEAITSATHTPGLLSAEAISELARRIHDSARHA